MSLGLFLAINGYFLVLLKVLIQVSLVHKLRKGGQWVALYHAVDL